MCEMHFIFCIAIYFSSENAESLVVQYSYQCNFIIAISNAELIRAQELGQEFTVQIICLMSISDI